MKLPWFSSEDSSKKTNENSSIKQPEPLKDKQINDIQKTYQLSSLPERLQKIAILIRASDQEIQDLQKKLEVTLIGKKELELQLTKELKAIDEEKSDKAEQS